MDSDYSNSEEVNPNSAQYTEISKEIMGHLLSIEFDHVSFDNFEMYNFIEDVLKVEIDEMSPFRDSTGEPLGVVVVSLTQDISVARAKLLHGLKFKDSQLRVRLYTQLSLFWKFIVDRCSARIPIILDTIQNLPPIIYADGLEVDNLDSIQRFFEKIGPITKFRVHPINENKNNVYFEIHYQKEVDAVKCVHIFCDNPTPFGIPHVGIVYRRASQRSFVVKDCQDQDFQELLEIIDRYGVRDQIKYGKNEIFVLMETTDGSRACCALLNQRKVGDSLITTNFIDFESFQEIKDF